MNLYIGCIHATRFEVTCIKPVSCPARNEKEATELLMNKALVMFPVDDDYGKHGVVITELSRKAMYQCLNMLF